MNFWFGATAALVVFHLMASLGGTPNATDWLAAFAATLSTTVLSALTIATAISLSGGAPQFQKLPQMIQFGGLVAVANTSLALLAVSILWLDPGLLWLLLVPLVTVFLAYRAYLSEREKGERLEFLYQSGRILQHSPELDTRDRRPARPCPRHVPGRAGRGPPLPAGGRRGRPPDDERRQRARDGDGARALLRGRPDRPADPERAARVLPHARPVRDRPARPPPGDGGPAPRRVRIDRLAPCRQPADRGHVVQRRRPAPARDAGQPGRRRPRERPARAVAVRALATQGAAPLPGLPRPPDRARQPEPLRGTGRRADRRQVERRGGPSSCSWISTTSRWSTTRSATWRAIGSSSRSRTAFAAASGPATSPRVSAATSSPILLEDGGDLAEGIAVCRRILEALQAPLQIDGQELTIGASVGIAAARPESERADELLRNADVAMYTAKAAGKNGYAVFEPTMHATLVERHALAPELSKSIGRGELARLLPAHRRAAPARPPPAWRRSSAGATRPGASSAPTSSSASPRRTGRSLPSGAWMLEESCREVGGWRRDRGLDRRCRCRSTCRPCSSSSRPSSTTSRRSSPGPAHPGFRPDPRADRIGDVPRHRTRRSPGSRPSEPSAIRIAIDDFGTGYSSLGYLRRFPVDILKIAREFIGTEDSRSDDWAFARAIIALGQTLGLRVRRRGHRDADQLQALRELGCEPDRAISSPAGRPVRRLPASSGRRRSRGRADRRRRAPSRRPGRVSPLSEVAPDVHPLRASLVGLRRRSSRGRPARRPADLNFRWGPLSPVGFLAQVVLFSDAVASRIGDLGPALYVASTLGSSPRSCATRRSRVSGSSSWARSATWRRSSPTAATCRRRRGRSRASARPPRRSTRTAPWSPSPTLPWLIDIFALPRWVPVRQRVQHRRRPHRHRASCS